MNYEIKHLQRIQSSTVKCSFTLIFTKLRNTRRVDLDPPYRDGDLETELKGEGRQTLLSRRQTFINIISYEASFEQTSGSA